MLHNCHSHFIANSRSQSYKFRQASDFWYLTGFEEPDAALILGQSPTRHSKMLL